MNDRNFKLELNRIRAKFDDLEDQAQRIKYIKEQILEARKSM